MSYPTQPDPPQESPSKTDTQQPSPPQKKEGEKPSGGAIRVTVTKYPKELEELYKKLFPKE